VSIHGIPRTTSHTQINLFSSPHTHTNTNTHKYTNFAAFLSFWVCFNKEAAIASSIIFFIAIYHWYYYCARIYNRFYLPGLYDYGSGDTVRFNTDDDDDDDNPALTRSPMVDPVRRGSKQGRKSRGASLSKERKTIIIESSSTDNSPFMHAFSTEIEAPIPRANADAAGLAGAARGREKEQSSVPTSHGHKKSWLKKGLRSYFTGKSKTSPSASASSSSSSSSSSPPSSSSAGADGSHSSANHITVLMEGYMSKLVSPADVSSPLSKKVVTFKLRKWDNLYFVLYSNGNLFFYLGRPEYAADPVQNRLNDRPIVTSLYKLVLSSPSLPSSFQASSSSSDAASVISDASSFRLDLKPKGGANRDWTLRLDTQEDFDLWVNALSRFCDRVGSI